MNVNVNVMERQGNVAVYGFGFSSIHVDMREFSHLNAFLQKQKNRREDNHNNEHRKCAASRHSTAYK